MNRQKPRAKVQEIIGSGKQVPRSLVIKEKPNHLALEMNFSDDWVKQPDLDLERFLSKVIEGIRAYCYQRNLFIEITPVKYKNEKIPANFRASPAG